MSFRRQHRIKDFRANTLKIHNTADELATISTGTNELNLNVQYLQLNAKFRIFINDDSLIFQKKNDSGEFENKFIIK